ncbi:MAG: hypothetical protein GXY08_11720 [Ruminococcus sp.]|nr:hypothetical protein [Ruminococcus sp.]
MNLNKIKTYFIVDYRGIGKNEAVLSIFPEIVFNKNQYEEVRAAIQEVRKRFDGLYTSTTQSILWITISVNLTGFPKKCHDEIIECLVTELNNVTEIQKVIINVGRPVADNTKVEIEDDDECGQSDWNQVLGLTKLSLNYMVHAEGLEGECFIYSVYFNDYTADEEKADVVKNAINSYDFKLKGNDYIGYLDVSIDKNKVSIYLDLGNVELQNENNIIHGILLAINSIHGIKKVIINEGCL